MTVSQVFAAGPGRATRDSADPRRKSGSGYRYGNDPGRRSTSKRLPLLGIGDINGLEGLEKRVRLADPAGSPPGWLRFQAVDWGQALEIMTPGTATDAKSGWGRHFGTYSLFHEINSRNGKSTCGRVKIDMTIRTQNSGECNGQLFHLRNRHYFMNNVGFTRKEGIHPL